MLKLHKIKTIKEYDKYKELNNLNRHSSLASREKIQEYLDKDGEAFIFTNFNKHKPILDVAALSELNLKGIRYIVK